MQLPLWQSKRPRSQYLAHRMGKHPSTVTTFFQQTSRQNCCGPTCATCQTRRGFSISGTDHLTKKWQTIGNLLTLPCLQVCSTWPKHAKKNTTSTPRCSMLLQVISTQSSCLSLPEIRASVVAPGYLCVGWGVGGLGLGLGCVSGYVLGIVSYHLCPLIHSFILSFASFSSLTPPCPSSSFCPPLWFRPLLLFLPTQ